MAAPVMATLIKKSRALGLNARMRCPYVRAVLPSETKAFKSP
jgi:hypothetical protein